MGEKISHLEIQVMQLRHAVLELADIVDVLLWRTGVLSPEERKSYDVREAVRRVLYGEGEK
jgi:hypothetical protein